MYFLIDPPTTVLYTLSLHDALPISNPVLRASEAAVPLADGRADREQRQRHRAVLRSTDAVLRQAALLDQDVVDAPGRRDRKSTRLNSSHSSISYAVFCLKKKSTHHG